MQRKTYHDLDVYTVQGIQGIFESDIAKLPFYDYWRKASFYQQSRL